MTDQLNSALAELSTAELIELPVINEFLHAVNRFVFTDIPDTPEYKNSRKYWSVEVIKLTQGSYVVRYLDSIYNAEQKTWEDSFSENLRVSDFVYGRTSFSLTEAILHAEALKSIIKFKDKTAKQQIASLEQEN